MSTAPAPATAPDPAAVQAAAQAAHATLLERVYAPVLFHKLAAHGVPMPRDDHERQQLLYLGHQLYGLYQDGLAKQAAAQGTLLDYAVSQVDQLAGALPPGDDDQFAKTAAAEALQYPEIRAAAAAVVRGLYAAG